MRNTGAFDWREAEKQLSGIDAAVPHSARIWGYWLNGKDNFRADQVSGERFRALYPAIDVLARACEEFTLRLVARLARTGVRQFVDVGVGLPPGMPSHTAAQQVVEDARVVYIDNDPLVLAHARAWLRSAPGGAVGVIDADLTDPDALLAAARGWLDFGEPVAVLLMSVLRHIPISDPCDSAARRIVSRLAEALAPGGYLAVCDITATSNALTKAVQGYNATGADPWYLRTPAQLTRLLTGTGMDLTEPGVVPIHQWHPHPGPTPPVDAWGGLARTPTTKETTHR